MTFWKIDPALAIAEARKLYFAQAGLPADGGYSDRWVSLRIGPIPFGIPNTEARRKAVPLHDIHHLVTGYATDWRGEGEISAWEIGAGCGRYTFAWLINLQGMVAGWIVSWRRTWRAFVRGRRSQSLYSEGITDAVLRDSLASLRKRLLAGDVDLTPRMLDYVVYAGWCALAAAFALLTVAPVALAIWVVLRWLSS